MAERSVRFYVLTNEHRQLLPSQLPFDQMRTDVRSMTDEEAYVKLDRVEVLGSAYDPPDGRHAAPLIALDRIEREVRLRIERRRNYRPLSPGQRTPLAGGGAGTPRVRRTPAARDSKRLATGDRWSASLASSSTLVAVGAEDAEVLVDRPAAELVRDDVVHLGLVRAVRADRALAEVQRAVTERAGRDPRLDGIPEYPTPHVLPLRRAGAGCDHLDHLPRPACSPRPRGSPAAVRRSPARCSTRRGSSWFRVRESP